MILIHDFKTAKNPSRATAAGFLRLALTRDGNNLFHRCKSSAYLTTLMRRRMRVVDLLHEIWIHADEDGMELESCCLAGPDGDGARELLGPSARRVHTFTAGSHFEAMTIYYKFFGWGPYTAEFQWDYESYPAEWLARQKSVAT